MNRCVLTQAEVDAGLRARFQDAAAREHRAADQVLGRLMRSTWRSSAVRWRSTTGTWRSGCGTSTDGGVVRLVGIEGRAGGGSGRAPW